MPEPSPKLQIPRPLSNETVSLAAFREILDTIDANAASQAELDQRFDPASGHKHTGQDGDAPPIPLAGIDPQARTSAGGTEANRLAVTDNNGRVGDANKLGGVAATSYARKDQTETISGDWTIGDDNQHVLRRRSVELKIDTRTVVLTYDANGRLTKVEEMDGSTVVKTTNLTYDESGRLSQVQETAGGVTVTSTLSYDASGKLVSASKAVG